MQKEKENKPAKAGPIRSRLSKKRGAKMLSCIDVAKYFLALTDLDAGDLISNLKLQKLLYYAQGFHLALFDEPIFPERIMAWIHGPVVPDAYRHYKEYGANSIPVPRDIDLDNYDLRATELLDEVFRVFGQFSAWKLRNMTHEEPPWRDAAPTKGEITPEAMRTYFKTQLMNDSPNQN